MSEEETHKAEEQINTEGDTGEGDKSKELDPITRAEQAAERLEKATEARKDSTRELKEERAKQILGGQTTASQAPEKKAELSDEQYYKDILAGKYNLAK